jgi:hypothetical protein
VDTLIVAMPEDFYIDVQGERTLLIQPFTRALRRLMEQQAENLGEQLHHAELWITTSPSVVWAKGSMHDCDACRAGVRRALRELREKPDRELIVGVLYWAAP